MDSTKQSSEPKHASVTEVINSTTSVQYAELITIIKTSGALENEFFDKCAGSGLSLDQLQKYLINWYPITESFAKYGLLYTHLVAKHISEKYQYASVSYGKYERFFCQVLEISSGEFRISRIEPNEFHPRTFTRLAPKLGIRVKDLVNRSMAPVMNQQTGWLEDRIKKNFSKEGEILSGFANYFVVETIAYNIVESMDRSFGRMEGSPGVKLYTPDDLLYITEHLRLEVEHCGEVKDMLATLELERDGFDLLRNEVEKLAHDFGQFWRALLTT